MGRGEAVNIFHRFKNPKVQFLVNLIIITFGCAVYAGGIFLFLDPNSLASGGISGVSIILSHLVGLLPTGTWIILLNVPLLLIAIWKFGFKFVFTTIYAIVVSSLFINLGHKYIGAATNDTLLAAIAGPVMVSIGIGLLFHAGASTGGTDILVKLMRLKFKSVSTGTVFMIFDIIVIIASAISFGRFELSLYAGVCVVIQTIVLDKLLYGFDSAKMIYVISENNEKITRRLLDELDVGATIVHSHGGYTGKNIPVIMCVLKKHQLPKAKEMIRDEDKNAFLIVTNATEILGEGYKSHEAADL